MVMHDTETKTIVPIFDFVSTSHTTATISKYLLTFRNKIEAISSSCLNVAPVIVIDFSWPFINALLEIFNYCTIETYLNIWYQKIIQKKQSIESWPLKTTIYLCSTHFLKMIISKVRKFNLCQNVIKCFIFSFTLLQNSKTIDEFESYLVDIFNLFCQKVRFILVI